MAELLLERCELGDRRLQPVVLQQDACVPRVRLQQPDILGTEPRLVVGVADQHDPDRPAIAVQHCCERTSQLALCHQRVRTPRAASPAQHDDAFLREDRAHKRGLGS